MLSLLRVKNTAAVWSELLRVWWGWSELRVNQGPADSNWPSPRENIWLKTWISDLLNNFFFRNFGFLFIVNTFRMDFSLVEYIIENINFNKNEYTLAISRDLSVFKIHVQKFCLIRGNFERTLFWSEAISSAL